MTRWLWTAADGSVTDLSAWGAGWYVLGDGLQNVLAPSYEFTTQQYAGVDGATLQQVTAAPGSPVLPLQIVADSHTDLRARLRALAHSLRPRLGQGTLQAVADDGTSRSLPCFYAKGLESGTYRGNLYRAALEFWSPSPWWRGNPLAYSYGLAAASTFFPILPFTLSATTIAGTTTIDLSDTDAPTYPTWTITGPGDQLTLANDTTGQTLVLNASIGDGVTVTIDTRPGQQSIRRGDGLSLFGSLASDPALWPLLDGVNVVRAILTNAGANSRIALAAERLYSGAV